MRILALIKAAASELCMEMQDCLTLDKKALRRRVLASRRALSEDEIHRQSEAIADHILHFELYKEAKTVMCYAAMKDEVQTYALMQCALTQGKRVVIPRVRDKAGLMDAVLLHSLDDLVCGTYGIMTAKETKLLFVQPEKIDLVLLPGVAFDICGHRLGMGAGFYDRFLARAKRAVRLGLALSCQMVASIPVMTYDASAGYIATEDGIIDCIGVADE